ncbi:hypothetical protein PF007_g20243 [Phytophthora fragariae]|uniref:Uncharacterized protein n=1 Tax=Phytophthora fragariae TaxID=53985 RepID=A0A6A3R2I6_9STRA|nr:hypothetical protein PF007_g20243 [Phytophthora fragariae]
MPDIVNTPPPLLAVDLLFRSKPQFSDLHHVVNSVSVFLDSSVELPLHKACQLSSLKLLSRLWDSSEVYAGANSTTTDCSWTLRKFIRNDRHYRQHQFTLSLTEAVRLGSMEMVRWLAARFEGCKVKKSVVVEAAKAGCLKALMFFYARDNTSADPSIQARGVGFGVEWTGEHLTAAVENGHGSVAWWLGTHFPHAEDMSKALNAAVCNGDIAMAEWLLARGTAWTRGDSALQPAHHAATKGRVDVLQWLGRIGQLDGVIGLVLVAAKAGQLHAVRWLLDRDTAIQEASRKLHLTALGREASLSIHIAAVSGCLRTAKYLRAQAKAPTDSLQRVTQTLEQKRQLEIFSRQFGSSAEAAVVSGKTMTLAARNGHLQVVKWLYDEYDKDPDANLFDRSETSYSYPPVYTVAMDSAAQFGHLKEVKYLHQLSQSTDTESRKKRKRDEAHSQPPKCTKRAMNGAAANGHLAVVEWLDQNRTDGCTVEAMDSAAAGGHLEVVKWLHEHRSEGCSTAAIDGAAAKGHLEVVQWLHENTRAGCTTSAMDQAAAGGHLNVVKWLHEHRTEGCTTSAMDLAAMYGHLNVVKWLHRNRTEGCTTTAIDETSETGNLRMLQWLQRHRSERGTEEALSLATIKNHFEVFLFLNSQCHIRCTDNQPALAYENFRQEIQDWIIEHYPEFRGTIPEDD